MSNIEISEVSHTEPKELTADDLLVRAPRIWLRRVWVAMMAPLLARVFMLCSGSVASADSFTSLATVCFQQTGGGAYTGPTAMQVYYNGNWYFLASDPGSNSGCRTWLTPDNRYIRFATAWGLHGGRVPAGGSSPAPTPRAPFPRTS